MKTSEELKTIVKEKYGDIAAKSSSSSSCCSTSCCSDTEYSVLSEDYTKLKGYNPDADLGLGCGLPTEFARIKEGDTVVDLGSGAGNDVFLARSLAGGKGKVMGIDMTEEMIEKARANSRKLGYDNVEFLLGDIENLPLEIDSVDVIVSNCVLNLVPDKRKAFSEIYRVLKPGGHFSVSDIVSTQELPEPIKKAAELYTGCIAGAVPKQEYLSIIENAGFKNIVVQKQRLINMAEVLSQYLNKNEQAAYRNSNLNLLSITVFGQKI